MIHVESMKEIIGKSESTKEILTNIPLSKLPLFKLVGKQTGFRVSVVATQGDQCEFTDKGVKRTIIIEPECAAISIVSPNGNNQSHAPFWNNYNLFIKDAISKSLEGKK